MKKRLSIFKIITLVFIFFSCKGQDKESPAELKKENNNQNYELVQSRRKLNIGLEKEVDKYLVNDSLINLWLNSLVLISKEHNFFESETLLDKNDHSPNVIDTITTLKFKNSKIVTYSTEDFYAIEFAHIKTDKIALSDEIKVGIQKKDFEKIVDKTIKLDTIKIGDLEHTSEFEFLFDRETLSSIKYSGYID